MRMSWMLAAVGLAALTNAATNAAWANPDKWRASLVLVTEDERTCGAQHASKFYVDIEGNIVRRSASSGSTYDLRLLAPLNADGSGRVKALDHKNRVVTLDIDPGNGPRTIRYTPPYSVCTWAWVPLHKANSSSRP